MLVEYYISQANTLNSFTLRDKNKLKTKKKQTNKQTNKTKQRQKQKQKKSVYL